MKKKEKNEVKIFIKDLEDFVGKFKNDNELGKACKRLFDFLMNKKFDSSIEGKFAEKILKENGII